MVTGHSLTELACLSAIVHGRVQGVYFRAFAEEQARRLGLTGYVRNLLVERSVQVVAEGERAKLEELATRLKAGPSGARVEEIDIKWEAYTKSFSNFEIRH
ncbi:MAG: acylphosphatase [Dehalococcoidia bacterium]|nr:acylphosphatase [Dehalococcoidia bacterium]